MSFASLDDVMPEVERLLAGHETVGNWSLAQICNHLATSLKLVALAPAPAGRGRLARLAHWPIRRWFFAFEGFPTGAKTPNPRLVPKAGLDPRREAEALRGAIALFQEAPGPFRPHPVLGPLTRDEWLAFLRRHCAHHLGFAVPT